jgi:hypothetical protein
MADLQAKIREKDEKMAELLALREELDSERRRAEELRLEMERSHEMEQSERQRLVSSVSSLNANIFYLNLVLFSMYSVKGISAAFVIA